MEFIFHSPIEVSIKVLKSWHEAYTTGLWEICISTSFVNIKTVNGCVRAHVDVEKLSDF